MSVSLSRPDPTSPSSVSEAGFSTVRRGFDPSEVRAFLTSVAAEIRRLNDQTHRLQADLADANARARRPIEIDDATVTRFLGEEATRVLQTARDSASGIKIRAEEGAAEMLREAADQAAEIRRVAEVHTAQIRQDGAAEAESIIAQAKSEGRSMVAEARAYRERVLADLDRRTTMARQQIEELEQARQRLLQVFERSRLVAIDVSAELESLRPPTELVDLSPVTGPVPVIVPASSRPLPRSREPQPRPERDDAPADDAAQPGSSDDRSQTPTADYMLEMARRRLNADTQSTSHGARITSGTTETEATSSDHGAEGRSPGNRHGTNVVDLFPGEKADDDAETADAELETIDGDPELGRVEEPDSDWRVDDVERDAAGDGPQPDAGVSGDAVLVSETDVDTDSDTDATGELDDARDRPDTSEIDDSTTEVADATEPDAVDPERDGRGTEATVIEDRRDGDPCDDGSSDVDAVDGSGDGDSGAGDADDAPTDGVAQAPDSPATDAVEDGAVEDAVADDVAVEDAVADDVAVEDHADDDVAGEDRADGVEAGEDRAEDDMAGEDHADDDMAGEDRAIDDVAGEDRAIDDEAGEDHAVDDIFARLRREVVETGSHSTADTVSSTEAVDTVSGGTAADEDQPHDNGPNDNGPVLAGVHAAAADETVITDTVITEAGITEAGITEAGITEAGATEFVTIEVGVSGPHLDATGGAASDEPTGEEERSIPAAFAARDAIVGEATATAARQVKRLMGDEQNRALHRLGEKEPVTTVDEIVGSAKEHAHAYHGVVADAMLDAAIAGAGSSGRKDSANLRRTLNKGASTKPVFQVLDDGVVAPLRVRLQRAIAETGGDNAELTQRVRSIYREIKTQVVDIAMTEMAVAAYGIGVSKGVKAGTPQVWAVDPRQRACPDCEDNSLSPPVPAGDAFPTGHVGAPAHPGCTCLTVPASTP